MYVCVVSMFMYVCLYVNTNMCSPHSCICTFQIMTAHLGVFADASRQTIRSHLHTPTKANTHERTYSVQTHSHTRLIIISSCYSVTLPPLLLLTSQEYAVAYASLFRWFFMLLLRLVYGLHYMPYYALTVINAHSRAYFARFGRAGGAGEGKSKRFLLYIHRDSHMFIMLNLCAFVVFGFYIALSGDALNAALM